MIITPYNPRDRYKRRAADQMAGLLTVVALIAVSFGLGFWLGGKNSSYQYGVMQREVVEVNEQNLELQNTVTELRAEAQTAVARYEQVQKLYNQMAPEGPMRDLVKMLKDQVDEGRDPERLAFLIRSARPPRNCSEAQSRRFVVSTPAYSGPESKLVLADGALVVAAEGASALNSQGKPEAWFDPSKRIKLSFALLGGQVEKKEAILPVHHSVVVDDREYRFTITDGARSFAKVTYDSCDYP
ncbi:MAG: hypothetical protein CMH26_02785 [Micavibrio sp.]|nr:hypothetical protein [Micavibrio sp.]|tara:strand:- start:1679 stop:2404 length:726 start_codon:yes stop_codon:yes gene_type:complete